MVRTGLACSLALLTLAVWGCASSESPPNGVGPDSGVDAAPPIEGDGGGDPVGDCFPEDPLVPADSLPVCDLCEDARCVPNFALDEDQRAMLAPCDDSNSCVPELFVDTNGNFTLPRCTSVGGAEGRCLSPCIPQVAEQASLLPKDVCEGDWLCAPCFDPLTGENTGACNQGCDTGPTEDPVTFDNCCNDLGSCVPQDLVPAEQLEQLGTDTCTEPGTLCAPNDLANPSFIPPTCDSVNGAEGRCLPECLPDIQAQASLLPQADCAEYHLCAPCYDPVTGDDTGACRLNGDEPVHPPQVFDPCCDGLGSCVPEDLVPEDQVSQLGVDTCTEPDTLCAPNDLTNPSFTPVVCDSVGGAEGRCLPACLPAIQEQADLLDQDICLDDHLCAPCYDPTTGEDTGACRINGDEPGQDPVVFSPCCNDLGLCVPEGLVPADQRDDLGTDVCTGEDELCAPSDLIDPEFIPPTCSSVAGAEGRCLPECLPAVQEQADQLPQDICAEYHLCVPCYDPFTGEPTGACSLNGDEPSEPPVVFERCCDDRGACVPSELVPDDQQDDLGQDTCSEADALCAPDNLVSGTPEYCPSIGGGEGRCLPDCLPAVQEQADQLQQSTCDPGELCAPCTDPITGEDTGACRLNGDEPTEPPYTFPECCDGISLCIPEYLVPEDQQEHLDGEGCADDGFLCVPKVFVEDPNYQPDECTAQMPGLLLCLTPSDVGPGVCLPACLPALRDFPGSLLCAGDSCPDAWKCAPCEDPLNEGESTGACDL
jgi:hypothetical protein